MSRISDGEAVHRRDDRLVEVRSYGEWTGLVFTVVGLLKYWLDAALPCVPLRGLRPLVEE